MALNILWQTPYPSGLGEVALFEKAPLGADLHAVIKYPPN